MEDNFIRYGSKSVPNVEEPKKEAVQIAKNTLAKRKTVTVRLTERDLIKVKTKAAQEGLPYQTYIASLIHKHT